MAHAHTPIPNENLRAFFLDMKRGLYDRNTGLYSYQYHFDDLQQMAERRPALGVVHLEISGLDRIEGSCGWQVFDRILERVARELQALRGFLYPPSGLLSVIGVHGGSFLLFLSETLRGGELTGAELGTVAGKIRQRLVQVLRHEVPAGIVPEVEICAGHSLVHCEPVFRIERLIYRAIDEARNLAVRVASREDRRVDAELRQIIQSGMVETHFQPIIDVASQEIHGYEALTRGPRGTMLEAPTALFGVSDRMKVSPLLDSVCRRRALHAARGLESGMKLFLNSLPATLANPRFAEEYADDLRTNRNLSAASVVLEITERTGIDDFEEFGRRLERLRAKGFQVAIDDVGTGYSSLQTISEVRPEYLKIDLSLVKNIHQSLIKQEIVSSILQIGERIGARVIAEGIESEEEFQIVKGFGVRLGQGYYFGAPAPTFFPSRRTEGCGH